MCRPGSRCYPKHQRNVNAGFAGYEMKGNENVLACEWPDMLPPRLSLGWLDSLLAGRLLLLPLLSSRTSCKRQAMALSRRIRDASLTRRRNSGSVVRVRKVSLRIFE